MAMNAQAMAVFESQMRKIWESVVEDFEAEMYRVRANGDEAARAELRSRMQAEFDLRATRFVDELQHQISREWEHDPHFMPGSETKQ